MPTAAVGATLLAEGYASLAADWHVEWMLPETLEEGLEARLRSPRSWLDDLDPDEQIKTIHSAADAHGGRPDLGPGWLAPTSWHRSSVGVWQAPRP